MNQEILKDGIWNAVSRCSNDDVLNFIKNGVDVNFQKHGFTLLYHLLWSFRWDKQEDLDVLQAFIDAGVDTRKVNNHCKRLPIFGIAHTTSVENFSHHEIKIKAFKMLFDKENDFDNEKLLCEVSFNVMHECFDLFKPSKETLEHVISVLNTEVKYIFEKDFKLKIEKSIEMLKDILKQK
jgi:hypothetical protein